MGHIDHVLGQESWVRAVEHIIFIKISVYEGLIGLLVRIYAPDVQLELRGPFSPGIEGIRDRRENMILLQQYGILHEMEIPLSVVELESIIEATVEAEAVEISVGEDMGESSWCLLWI